ncbi:PREDICTED: protein SCAI-like, partial [Rhagoletis zephyria]|uniref:protein SCAI-like n=1 Tax=Rhagoletis zephyria TaxID=28612 RepID=UPI00081142EA
SDNIVNVVDMNNTPLVISHRMSAGNVPPMEKVMPSHLALQEVMIIGNCSDQVKFSELTLDMFRIIQALEREPQEDTGQLFSDSSPAPGEHQQLNGGLGGVEALSGPRQYRRDNPHKYLLFRPTFSQFLVFLTSSFKELPVNGVLLLYLSADGCFINSKQPEDIGYDYGGIATNTRYRDP